jgi:hypothetical protein
LIEAVHEPGHFKVLVGSANASAALHTRIIPQAIVLEMLPPSQAKVGLPKGKRTIAHQSGKMRGALCFPPNRAPGNYERACGVEKFFIALIGGTVVLIGVIMLVLPRPGVLVIAGGLAILWPGCGKKVAEADQSEDRNAEAAQFCAHCFG